MDPNRPVEHLVSDPQLLLDEKSLITCMRILDSSISPPLPQGSLHVAFVNPQECSQLHERFFDDPDPTDVMTFPGDPEDEHAGDIAICPQVAAASAKDLNMPFAEELTLYLVHACLHLAGLDDQAQAEQLQMRHHENLCMEALRQHNALLVASWSDSSP